MTNAVNEKRIYRAIAHIFLFLCSLMVIIPLLVVIMSSFTEETAAIRDGYSIFPKALSMEAYNYVFQRFDVLGRAYLISICVTLVGTILSLIVTSSLAYGVAQHDLPGRKVVMFYILFTMLFNGGLIPTYYFYTNVFHIKNTYFAYIIPGLLCSAFNIILLRNYFANSIPAALRESARLDGCGEFMIFVRIVIPLSTPILATVGMLNAIAYWNDWQNALYYMDDGKMASIQQLLRNMTNNVSFLASMSNVSTVGRRVPGVTVRMAIAVLSMVPLMLAFPFFEKFFVKGISVGAVKG